MSETMNEREGGRSKRQGVSEAMNEREVRKEGGSKRSRK